MRKISLATGVLGFSLLISAALVSVQGPSFVADLSGAEEAPPIDTGGSGLASFLLNPGSTALTFEVMAANIRDVTASHIHCGPAGANGPIGVTLSEGAVAGIFARGVITAPDPGNACGWANFAAIVGGMRSGNTYVNVHTDSRSDQIVRLLPATGIARSQPTPSCGPGGGSRQPTREGAAGPLATGLLPASQLLS